MLLFYFMSMIKLKHKENSSPSTSVLVDPSYKNKLMKISTKIDQWHNDVEN